MKRERPYLNWMFPGIIEPHPKDFEKKTIRVDLYTYKQSLVEDYECNYCGDAECFGECEDDDLELVAKWDWDAKYKPKPIKLDIEKINLQTLLDALPKDVPASDVKFRIYSDDNPPEHSVSFFYCKEIPADPEGYIAAKKQYDEAYAQFKIKENEYNEWEASEQLKEKAAELKALEDKIAKLKANK